MSEVVDFPKIKSPFVRQTINGRYVVTPEIAEGYEWVFTDPGVLAVDKLHGTNVCVVIKGGIVQAVHNRTQVLVASPKIDTRLGGQSQRALEGILHNLKHVKNLEGRIYGELIGPKINGNLHRLKEHRFVPFEYLKKTCHWKSWVRGDHPKTYQAISEWFKELPSLYTKRAIGEDELAEGLIFYHPDGVRMAKLRRSMFPWCRDIND